MPTLSIAAGMLADLSSDPLAAIDVAARAGFDAVGLRFVSQLDRPVDAPTIRRHLDATGITLLDVEFVRLVPGDRAASTNETVVAKACELQPRFLTTVSWERDHGRIVDWLDALCDRVNPAGIVPALEFLPFSGVRTVGEALGIVEAVGAGRAAVLIDNLHVARSGDRPDRVAAVPPNLVAFAQLSDASATGSGTDPDDLFHEAVTGRVLPGEGELPITEFLLALPPDIALSVEVLSEVLMTQHRPQRRAELARTALTRSLHHAERASSSDG